MGEAAQRRQGGTAEGGGGDGGWPERLPRSRVRASSADPNRFPHAPDLSPVRISLKSEIPFLIRKQLVMIVMEFVVQLD